jgi:integrase
VPTGVRERAGSGDQEPAEALTETELARLLAETPQEWRLFVEFLAHTGLRFSEAIGVRWSDIDIKGSGCTCGGGSTTASTRPRAATDAATSRSHPACLTPFNNSAARVHTQKIPIRSSPPAQAPL